LLDEISEIPPALQAKLLRVLQEKEFERIGSGQTIRVDVRVIATSNRNLKDEVSNGSFRDDLFYRLNVIPIDLPPLRQRLEDIPLLTDHFLNKCCQKIGLPTKTLSEKVSRMLLSYSWPGNVRELENLIERAVVISKNQELKISDFPPDISAGIPALGKTNMDVGMSIGEAEKILILKTLKAHGGNKSKAADVLGISARTLRNKLQEYGLSGSD
jgi:DNA-binding NtrC family response regulator